MNSFADLSTAARTVVAKVAPSLVSIGSDGRGSGIVVAAGKVLTNSHNLRDRTTSVTFADGRVVQGTVCGVDDDGDLVVLDVDTKSAEPVAWSEGAAEAGDIV